MLLTLFYLKKSHPRQADDMARELAKSLLPQAGAEENGGHVKANRQAEARQKRPARDELLRVDALESPDVGTKKEP